PVLSKRGAYALVAVAAFAVGAASVGGRSRAGGLAHPTAAATARPKPKPNPSSCTWFVSPIGSVRAGGRSQSHPTTLRYASLRAAPGAVVCLMKGVYRLTNTLIMRGGGRPDAWITYRSYDGKVS